MINATNEIYLTMNDIIREKDSTKGDQGWSLLRISFKNDFPKKDIVILTQHSNSFFNKNKKRCWFDYSLNKLSYNKPAGLQIFPLLSFYCFILFNVLFYLFIYLFIYYICFILLYYIFYCFILFMFYLFYYFIYSLNFSQKLPSPKKRNSKFRWEILKKY